MAEEMKPRVSRPIDDDADVDKGSHELKGVPGEWRLFAVKE